MSHPHRKDRGLFAELRCASSHLPTVPAPAGWLCFTISSALLRPLVCFFTGSPACCSPDLKASEALGCNPVVHWVRSPGTLSIFCFLPRAAQVQRHGQWGRGAEQWTLASRHEMHIPLSGKSSVVVGFRHGQSREEMSQCSVERLLCTSLCLNSLRSPRFSCASTTRRLTAGKESEAQRGQGIYPEPRSRVQGSQTVCW